MVSLNENNYKNIAELLLLELHGKDFYNGRIEYDTEEFYSYMTATIIIYRKPLYDTTDITNSVTRIYDLRPVWCDFKVIQSCGTVDNDFCWSELKKYLL